MLFLLVDSLGRFISSHQSVTSRCQALTEPPHLSDRGQCYLATCGSWQAAWGYGLQRWQPSVLPLWVVWQRWWPIERLLTHLTWRNLGDVSSSTLGFNPSTAAMRQIIAQRHVQDFNCLPWQLWLTGPWWACFNQSVSKTGRQYHWPFERLRTTRSQLGGHQVRNEDWDPHRSILIHLSSHQCLPVPCYPKTSSHCANSSSYWTQT